MANPQLENGHTNIANELMDALMRTNFGAYERRLLDCILRKTYGWNKKTDRISYSQFEESTGIDRRHIGRALISLRKRGIIICSGKGYALEYGLQKNYLLWDKFDTSSGNDLTPVGATKSSDNLTPVGGDLTPVGGDLTPVGATKSLPIEATTKAIKHLTKAFNKSIPQIPEWINKETWEAFLEMRKRIKQPPTDYAIKLLIIKLNKLKEDGNEPNEVLKESIMNNWKGLFPLKGVKDVYPRRNSKAFHTPEHYTRPEDYGKS